MQSTLPKVKSELYPIQLQGHEKAITKVKYNADGDLIFSCSKDHHVNVWYEADGSRLGTFNQHRGAVWDIDCSWDSQYLLTACADAQARLFEATTGKFLARMPHDGPVRVVSWSEGTQFFATANDYFKATESSKISIFDFPPENVLNSITEINQSNSEAFASAAPLHAPKHEIKIDSLCKTTSLAWTLGNLELIVSICNTSDDNPVLIKYDVEYGKEVVRSTERLRRRDIHSKRINNISFNNDKTLMITASADTTSKLIDPTTLEVIKTYQSPVPVNGCAISPTHPHVLIGGGQDTSKVTTSAASAGNFECKFFHMIYNEEFARIPGHFGPINSVAVHPFGKSFATGSEDGFVRLHHFDLGYLTTPTYFPEGVENILTSKD